MSPCHHLPMGNAWGHNRRKQPMTRSSGSTNSNSKIRCKPRATCFCTNHSPCTLGSILHWCSNNLCNSNGWPRIHSSILNMHHRTCIRIQIQPCNLYSNTLSSNYSTSKHTLPNHRWHHSNNSCKRWHLCFPRDPPLPVGKVLSLPGVGPTAVRARVP